MAHRSIRIQLRSVSFAWLPLLLLTLLPGRVQADDYHSNIPATDDDTDQHRGRIICNYGRSGDSSGPDLRQRWIAARLKQLSATRETSKKPVRRPRGSDS